MISARPNKKKRSEGIDNTLSTVFEYFGGDQIVPNDIEEVHINPKVTIIKDGAFSGNKSLKKIVLHEHLRKIGKSAFLNCASLEVVTLSTPPTGDEYDFDSMFGVKRIIFNEGLQEIGAEAFSGCVSLQNKMILPLSITAIGDRAFRCCYELRAVTLNEGLQKIGEDAFYYCEELDKLILPSTLTKISKRAFSNCDSLRRIEFSDGLEVIEESAFSGCRSLMRSGPTNDLFTLPSTVKRIDSFAFASGGYLGEVVLNEGLRSIGFCAFTLCHRLYNVTLPSTLVDIGVDAFEGCHSLRKMTLLGNLDLKIDRRIFDCHQSLRFEYPDISSRLETVIQTDTINSPPNTSSVKEEE